MRSSRSAPASGEGLEVLIERLGELLPEGPYLYPPEDHSDQSSEVLLAELIREQVLNRTREEIPHSVEVSVKEIAPREDGLVMIRAEVWAETESQKGILIGKGGAKVGEIGAAARRSLEGELGAKVHLDLQVRVRAAGAATRTCWTAWASSSAAASAPASGAARCHYDDWVFEQCNSTSAAWCRASRRTAETARC